MKNKLYYIFFICYAVVFAIILYINGVFTGEVTSFVNVAINVGFLVIIGILFIISTVSFTRLNNCTNELENMTWALQQEYVASGGKNLGDLYLEKKDFFNNDELREAFNKYRTRMKGYRTRRGFTNTCDLEEYINEDLIDQVGMNFFNAGISGTFTGLGILGTFLGLSLGLGSFNGDDIYTISDNVGPLLTGMKVAFHTSVYGIFFSLIFNFAYRSIMSDAYEKLENFLNAFRQYAMPVAATEDENMAAMLVYQANMSNSMKQILELMKGNAAEQTAGVERIVNRFMVQMGDTLGTTFEKLGNDLKKSCDAQVNFAVNSRDLMKAASAMLEANKETQERFAMLAESQAAFAKELQEQKKEITDTCDEISNQLYAFEQMRKMYEK